LYAYIFCEKATDLFTVALYAGTSCEKASIVSLWGHGVPVDSSAGIAFGFPFLSLKALLKRSQKCQLQ
jgi:hypothetical protein